MRLRDEYLHSAWQFDQDGGPKPILRDVLPILTRRLDGWEITAWRDTPHGELEGRCPIETLHTEPEMVVAAAERTVAELAFW